MDRRRMRKEHRQEERRPLKLQRKLARQAQKQQMNGGPPLAHMSQQLSHQLGPSTDPLGGMMPGDACSSGAQPPPYNQSQDTPQFHNPRTGGMCGGVPSHTEAQPPWSSDNGGTTTTTSDHHSSATAFHDEDNGIGEQKYATGNTGKCSTGVANESVMDLVNQGDEPNVSDNTSSSPPTTEDGQSTMSPPSSVNSRDGLSCDKLPLAHLPPTVPMPGDMHPMAMGFPPMGRPFVAGSQYGMPPNMHHQPQHNHPFMHHSGGLPFHLGYQGSGMSAYCKDEFSGYGGMVGGGLGMMGGGMHNSGMYGSGHTGMGFGSGSSMGLCLIGAAANCKKKARSWKIHSLSTPEGTGVVIEVGGQPAPLTPWGAPYAVEGCREETILQLGEFLDSQMRNFMDGVGMNCTNLLDTAFMHILREKAAVRRERLHMLEDAKKRVLESAGTPAGMAAENDVAALTRQLYLSDSDVTSESSSDESSSDDSDCRATADSVVNRKRDPDLGRDVLENVKDEDDDIDRKLKIETGKIDMSKRVKTPKKPSTVSSLNVRGGGSKRGRGRGRSKLTQCGAKRQVKECSRAEGVRRSERGRVANRKGFEGYDLEGYDSFDDVDGLGGMSGDDQLGYDGYEQCMRAPRGHSLRDDVCDPPVFPAVGDHAYVDQWGGDGREYGVGDDSESSTLHGHDDGDKGESSSSYVDGGYGPSLLSHSSEEVYDDEVGLTLIDEQPRGESQFETVVGNAELDACRTGSIPTSDLLVEPTKLIV